MTTPTIIMIRFVLMILMLNLSNGQIPGIGSCPKVSVVSRFDVPRFLGHWYEVKKYPSVFTLGGRCISTDFGLLSNGSLHILFKQMRENHEDFSSGNGLVATNGAGIMRIDYPGARYFKTSKYFVLDTDYDNYAVVYACRSVLSLMNAKLVWVFSRHRYPSQHILDRAYDVIRINGLSTALLATTDNDNCGGDILVNTINNFRD